jgi:hypothetical protein
MELKRIEVREKLRAFVEKNPAFTLRQAQEACGASSPSHVQFHLRALKYERLTPAEIMSENEELRSQNEILTTKLAKIMQLARTAEIDNKEMGRE